MATIHSAAKGKAMHKINVSKKDLPISATRRSAGRRTMARGGDLLRASDVEPKKLGRVDGFSQV
jgi:hypothetical protein